MRSIHVCGADWDDMANLLEVEQLSVVFATPEGTGQVLELGVAVRRRRGDRRPGG